MDPLSVVTASSRLRPDQAGGEVLHTVLPGKRSFDDTVKYSALDAQRGEKHFRAERVLSADNDECGSIVSHRPVRFCSLGKALAMAMHAFS